MSEIKPSIQELLEFRDRNVLARLRTGIPAQVTKYDPLTNTVDVEIVVDNPAFNFDDDRTYETFPPIPSVPVLWPRAGGYVITLPLGPGDFVWLAFSELPLAEWRVTGQRSQPLDSRRHSIGYPYATPGAFPDVQPLSPEPTKDLPNRTTKMVLGKDGDPTQIVIDADAPVPSIVIGRDASDYVALASLVQGALDTIRTWVNGHTHVVATTGTAAAQTGTAAASASPLPAVGPVAATLTKAK